tara:strand:+ start:3951 stop:4181 length:231 start_codon:yes stop_codon:yes gene_type:complete
MATTQELRDVLEMLRELTPELAENTASLSEHPAGTERRMRRLIEALGMAVMLSREMELVVLEEIMDRTGESEVELS